MLVPVRVESIFHISDYPIGSSTVRGDGVVYSILRSPSLEWGQTHLLGFHLSQKQGRLGMPRDDGISNSFGQRHFRIWGFTLSCKMCHCYASGSVGWHFLFHLFWLYTRQSFFLGPWKPLCFHFGSCPLCSPHHFCCCVHNCYWYLMMAVFFT